VTDSSLVVDIGARTTNLLSLSRAKFFPQRAIAEFNYDSSGKRIQ